VQTSDWQRALTQAFCDLPSLLKYLQIDARFQQETAEAQLQFALRVPREYAALMRKGDPNDPLLRQVLPSHEELITSDGFIADPVGDQQAEQEPGLLHKYHGRILIMTTGACAVHCRYCFRRHYPYQKGTATPREMQNILDYLSHHPSIEEVILSGGDPLMINDNRLNSWLQQLQALPHLKRLRLHSRLPVVLPQRVTPDLLKLLNSSRLQSIMVLHINHANEISPALANSCRMMRDAGIMLFNQSVLLKGVNDNSDTLVTLSERLFEIGVMPYYLHLLDKVSGAAHFDLEENKIAHLKQQLLARLPGYLMPKMVREIAGESSKSPFLSASECARNPDALAGEG
jgi:L-lysine 2,3-aminomutase